MQSDLSPEEKINLTIIPSNNDLKNNQSQEDILRESLKPNAKIPYIFDGWIFTIDSDINNKFSFPRRRIIAIKNNQKLIGEYSFSATFDILIQEMQFKIKNGGLTPSYYSSPVSGSK